MLKWQKLNPALSETPPQHSLKDIVKRRELPIVVTITLPCFLRTKEVLKYRQPVAILNRRETNLVTGQTGSGIDFRFSADDNSDSLVETLAQTNPKCIEEIASYSPQDFILVLKKDCAFNNLHFREGATVVIVFLHTNQTTRKTFALICLENNLNCNVCLLADILINDALFTWFKIKERLKLKTLLRAFEPQKVRFKETANKLLPSGIVFLKNIKSCDLILTASCCATNIRYELFPLNFKIMAELSFDGLPEHVKLLGKRGSPSYFENLQRIEKLLHYDIYGPRFYGFLDVKGNAQSTDSSELIASINIGESLQVG